MRYPPSLAAGLQYSKHTYASLIKIYTKAGYASELLQVGAQRPPCTPCTTTRA